MEDIYSAVPVSVFKFASAAVAPEGYITKGGEEEKKCFPKKKR